MHREDGLIFNQLWHVGRISHPALQPDNMLPVAPSAIIPEGKAFIENERGEGELVPFVRPRALTIEEMPYLVRQYEHARGGTPKQPIPTVSRSTPPTAICSTNSSRPAPTGAPMAMAARSKTGRGCCSRSPRRC